MMENNKLAAYSQWHHEADTPTYTKDHVCIIGDAAHCTTPWQGSGAGQAIEDVMILETLLGEVKDILQLTAAFRAYDQVRRPRAQRIVKSSKETGIIMCGRGVDTGLDVDRFRDALPQRWHFIYALDVKDHKREALEVFRKME
jgi:salicylate hydroxylase